MYWSEANGLVEKTVGTIEQILPKLVEDSLDWHTALQDAIFAVNVTKQSSTQYSPFWLIHGYDPKLPGELNTGSINEDITEFESLHNLARSWCMSKQNLEDRETLAKAR